MTLGQKILAGFVASTVILIVVAVFSYRNSEKVVDSNEWVSHTHEVLTELSLLRASAVDGETSVRGFVISGNENFLDLHRNAVRSIDEHLSKLKSLVADNPGQQQIINQLQKQLQLRVDIMTKLIALRRQDCRAPYLRRLLPPWLGHSPDHALEARKR